MGLLDALAGERGIDAGEAGRQQVAGADALPPPGLQQRGDADGDHRFRRSVCFAFGRQSGSWSRGLVAARIHRGERPIVEVLDEHIDVARVSGTAVFMFKDLGKTPPALVNNLRHNKVLHRTTLIVSVDTADSPRVPMEERAHVKKVEAGKMELLPEPFSLDEVLQDLGVVAAGYLGDKTLDLRYRIDEGVPDRLLGDATPLTAKTNACH